MVSNIDEWAVVAERLMAFPPKSRTYQSIPVDRDRVLSFGDVVCDAEYPNLFAVLGDNLCGLFMIDEEWWSGRRVLIEMTFPPVEKICLAEFGDLMRLLDKIAEENNVDIVGFSMDGGVLKSKDRTANLFKRYGYEVLDNLTVIKSVKSA